MSSIDKLKLGIKQTSTGDELGINLYRFRSELPGPHVHIQANVHGAELQGNAVIYELIKYFEQNTFNGTITFIPMANPMGVNAHLGAGTYGRFSPTTGDNWNRLYENIFANPRELTGLTLGEFASRHLDTSEKDVHIEFKKLINDAITNIIEAKKQRGISENKLLFLTLQKVASSADIVLDLHTGPKACRYIYSAEYQRESVVHFEFPFVLNIPNTFAGAMDEATFINWVGLKRNFKELGRDFHHNFEAYTVELGSEEVINLEEAKVDAQKILNFLHSKSVIKQQTTSFAKIKQIHCDLSNYKSYNSQSGGLIEYVGKPGDFIKKGETLYKILKPYQYSKLDRIEDCLEEIKALEDCYIINHATTSNVASGAQIYQVMENFKVIDQ